MFAIIIYYADDTRHTPPFGCHAAIRRHFTPYAADGILRRLRRSIRFDAYAMPSLLLR